MRIRTVKPEFWANEKMSILPDFTRLLAIGLLNYADDHGYFWANSKMVRGSLFPFEENDTRIIKALAELESLGYVQLGKSEDGRIIGHVVKFSVHQRVDKKQDSKIKHLAIFQERSVNDPGKVQDQSSLYRKGTGKGTCIAPPDGDAPQDPPFDEPAPAKPKRERDLLLDTLVSLNGEDPTQVTGTAWGRAGKALKEIREVCPDVTPDELRRRAVNYSLKWPGKLTSTALSAHWAESDKRPPMLNFTGAPIPPTRVHIAT